MENKTSVGITFLELLQVALIVLKLIGQIDWPWKIVLLPTWISIGIVVVAIVLIIWLNK